MANPGPRAASRLHTAPLSTTGAVERQHEQQGGPCRVMGREPRPRRTPGPAVPRRDSAAVSQGQSRRFAGHVLRDMPVAAKDPPLRPPPGPRPSAPSRHRELAPQAVRRLARGEFGPINLAGWAALGLQPVAHLFDGRRRALRLPLHRASRRVLHPPDQTCTARTGHRIAHSVSVQRWPEPRVRKKPRSVPHPTAEQSGRCICGRRRLAPCRTPQT